MIASISLRRRIDRLENARYLQSELELRRRIAEQVDTESRMRALGNAVGLDDPGLLEKLIEAGFTPANVHTLSRLPLALVAWGSGHVTSEEFRAAIDAALQDDTSADSLRLFRSWLDRRPSAGLESLWEELTKQRIRLGHDVHEGEVLLQQAKSIALASGGLLGIGQVCSGEQRVLDRICEVYQLQSD
ncbi:MAG: hypothetical protein AAF802_22535 [Planctomycetota bacterium]